MAPGASSLGGVPIRHPPRALGAEAKTAKGGPGEVCRETVCFGRVEKAGEWGGGAECAASGGASGDVLAWEPGFPPEISPRAPPSPPVFTR